MNVFLGIRLGGANLDDTPLYIMIVYAVGVAVVIVFSEYLSLKTGRKATYKAANKYMEGQWALLSTIVKINKQGNVCYWVLWKCKTSRSRKENQQTSSNIWYGVRKTNPIILIETSALCSIMIKSTSNSESTRVHKRLLYTVTQTWKKEAFWINGLQPFIP